MSYMRGEHYVWSDDSRLHVWVADGSDGWEHSGWAESYKDSNASGVSIPVAVLDELVVMRLAEILDGEMVSQVIDRALSHHRGNGGCVALATHAARLKDALGAP